MDEFLGGEVPQQTLGHTPIWRVGELRIRSGRALKDGSQMTQSIETRLSVIRPMSTLAHTPERELVHGEV